MKDMNEYGKRQLHRFLENEYSKDLGDCQNISTNCYLNVKKIIEKLCHLPDSICSGRRHIALEFIDNGDYMFVEVYNDKMKINGVLRERKNKKIIENCFTTTTNNVDEVIKKVMEFAQRER